MGFNLGFKGLIVFKTVPYIAVKQMYLTCCMWGVLKLWILCSSTNF